MHSESLERNQPEHGRRILPGEVTDNIIDHLHDDTKALQATALVSRFWLSSSQYHLFYMTCYQLLAPGRGLTEFLAWLSSAQYATSHVTYLFIEGNYTEQNSGDLSRPEICVQDVEIAMEWLTSLVTLTIRGVALTSRVPAGGHISSVATVDSSFHPVLDFLALFSEVEVLYVIDLDCVWNPDLTAICSLGLGPPIQLGLKVGNLTLMSKCLDGRWSGHRGIVHLFHHTQPKWQLRELASTINGVRLQETLDDFLPECEETLTSLHITAGSYISNRTVTPDDPQSLTSQPFPSLRHCRSLETLNLYFLFPPPESDRDGFESGIRLCDRALALNTEILLASPPTLRTVKLMFMYFEKPDYAIDRLFDGLEHWDRLDNAICRLEHAELVCTLAGDFKVVNDGPARHMFEVGYREADKDSDERIPLLKRVLPRTQASGRMKFTLLG